MDQEAAASTTESELHVAVKTRVRIGNSERGEGLGHRMLNQQLEARATMCLDNQQMIGQSKTCRRADCGHKRQVRFVTIVLGQPIVQSLPLVRAGNSLPKQSSGSVRHVQASDI